MKQYRLNLAISLAGIVLTVRISNGDLLKGLSCAERDLVIGTELNASEARRGLRRGGFHSELHEAFGYESCATPVPAGSVAQSEQATLFQYGGKSALYQKRQTGLSSFCSALRSKPSRLKLTT